MHSVMRFSLSLGVALTVACTAGEAMARKQIHAVGSSTVFPFVAAAAEMFGTEEDAFRTPIVESTGTGGGFKLFCEGIGERTPDLSNASRPIKEGEVKLCAGNGVESITEIALGFDGIVLANDKGQPRLDITIKQLFLGLARQVPVNGVLVDNPYKRWNEIDAALPDADIAVYGPPPTSGTRDAFVEIVMEKGCKAFDEYKAAYPEKKKRKKVCHELREDGGFIDAGENDNLIVQKLKGNPESYGIFGYSFLEENSASVQGSLMNNVEPTFENIGDGSYPVARSLYVYVKNAHIGKIAGLHEFITALTSEDAVSADGYLAEKGLIPMPAVQREEVRASVSALTHGAD